MVVLVVVVVVVVVLRVVGVVVVVVVVIVVVVVVAAAAVIVVVAAEGSSHLTCHATCSGRMRGFPEFLCCGRVRGVGSLFGTFFGPTCADFACVRTANSVVVARGFKSWRLAAMARPCVPGRNKNNQVYRYSLRRQQASHGELRWCWRTVEPNEGIMCLRCSLT